MLQRKAENFTSLFADPRYWLALGLAVVSAGFPRSILSGISASTIRYELFADAMVRVSMVMALVFLVASLFAHVRRQYGFCLDGSRQDLETIRALPWERFQLLMRGLFRDYGYHVEEQSGCAPYERPDLVVRKDGRSAVVCCKFWQKKCVDVTSVRKLFGLTVAGGADEVILVSTGDFAPEAWAFVQGKPIRLIDADKLRYMIRCAKATPSTED